MIKALLNILLRILLMLFELSLMFAISVVAMYYLAAAFARFVLWVGPDLIGK